MGVHQSYPAIFGLVDNFLLQKKAFFFLDCLRKVVVVPTALSDACTGLDEIFHHRISLKQKKIDFFSCYFGCSV